MANPEVSPFHSQRSSSAGPIPSVSSPSSAWPGPTVATPVKTPAKSPLASGPTNFSLPSATSTPSSAKHPPIAASGLSPTVKNARPNAQPDGTDLPDEFRLNVVDLATEPTTALPEFSARRLGPKTKSAKPAKEKDSGSSSWFGFKHPKSSRSNSRLGGRSSPESGSGTNGHHSAASTPPPPASSASARSGTPGPTVIPPGPSIYLQSSAPESTPDLSELSLASQDRPTLSRQHSLSTPSSVSPLSSKVSKHMRKGEKHRHRFQPFGHSKSKTAGDEKLSSHLKGKAAGGEEKASSIRSALSKASTSKQSTQSDNGSTDPVPKRSRSVDPYNTRLGPDSVGKRTANGMPLSSSSVNKDSRFFSRVAGNIISKIRNGTSKGDGDSSGPAYGHGDGLTFKVINLHLIEQTRKTRISPRLPDALDKTEFWMPAFPWRCIDYLNLYGCNHVGIYRVPGSERDIQKWKMKFDTELDVDLLQDDPGDINIVGSMFKSWLRDLPDEIFPKAIQERIASQHPNSPEVPQMLKDELSKLPPYNYYLLFAITCHISLLHTQQAENKMDYANLCICFQPCIRLNAFCFQFLVKHWKDCWQGCWTENEHLRLEAQWDLMELQGDFSGPRTLIESSPYCRSNVNGGLDPALGLLGDMSFSSGMTASAVPQLDDEPLPESEQRDDDVSSSTASTLHNGVTKPGPSVGSPRAPSTTIVRTDESGMGRTMSKPATNPILTEHASPTLHFSSLSPVQPVSPLGPF